MKEFGELAVKLIAINAAWIFNAWTVTILWRWFVAPHVVSYSPTIPMIIGVQILFAVFRSPTVILLKADNLKPFWERVAASYYIPPLALGLGWVVKQCL